METYQYNLFDNKFIERHSTHSTLVNMSALTINMNEIWLIKMRGGICLFHYYGKIYPNVGLITTIHHEIWMARFQLRVRGRWWVEGLLDVVRGEVHDKWVCDRRRWSIIHERLDDGARRSLAGNLSFAVHTRPWCGCGCGCGRRTSLTSRRSRSTHRRPYDEIICRERWQPQHSLWCSRALHIHNVINNNQQ